MKSYNEMFLNNPLSLNYATDNNNILIQGDCLEVIKYLISHNIIVDAVIADPPYGTTACKWDTIIPFDEMWTSLNSILKPNGAVILTASQPFTSALIMSNVKNFKYCWVWNKKRGSNYLQAKKQPLKYHEDICVFYQKQCTYNPQKTKGKPYKKTVRSNNKENSPFLKDTREIGYQYGSDERYPQSIIEINTSIGKGQLHPTQKPVELMEYLIKTYTNENDIVLDFTMGSGTTCVAAINTNRKFIGIEKEQEYFNISCNRCNLTKNIIE